MSGGQTRGEREGGRKRKRERERKEKERERGRKKERGRESEGGWDSKLGGRESLKASKPVEGRPGWWRVAGLAVPLHRRAGGVGGR